MKNKARISFSCLSVIYDFLYWRRKYNAITKEGLVMLILQFLESKDAFIKSPSIHNMSIKKLRV